MSDITLTITAADGTVTELDPNSISNVSYSREHDDEESPTFLAAREYRGSFTTTISHAEFKELYRALLNRYGEVASSRSHARRLARRFGRTGKRDFHIPHRWLRVYEAEMFRSSLFAVIRGNDGAPLCAVPRRAVRLSFAEASSS